MANFRLSVRKVERTDIPSIIKWAKNKTLTKHIHLNLPQTEQAGAQWFQRSLIDRNRNDFVIHLVDEENNRKAIGMLGMFNIDDVNKKAEYYILIGENEYMHRGIGYRTSGEMIANCFRVLGYNKITLSVDSDHYEAQNLAEKLGFHKEGLLAQDIINEDGDYVDRYVFGLTRQQWEEND